MNNNYLYLSTLYNYDDFKEYNYDDEKTSDCIMNLYLYILANNCENEEEKEKFLTKFTNIYNDLSEEQQELVKKEFFYITEKQNKNVKKRKK